LQCKNEDGLNLGGDVEDATVDTVWLTAVLGDVGGDEVDDGQRE